MVQQALEKHLAVEPKLEPEPQVIQADLDIDQPPPRQDQAWLERMVRETWVAGSADDPDEDLGPKTL